MKIRVVAIYAVLFNICCANASSLQTNIIVVGAGYVGLVTGACFAQQSSNNVIIVEKDAQKVQTLLTGRAPFVEPRLDALVSDGIRTGRLHFSSCIADACALVNPAAIFLCVGTPSREDGSADLSYVYQAAQEIGSVLRTYCVVVDKSTVPVGTARTVKKIIQDCLAQRGINLVFDVASNPEFLQEGSAVKNFIEPDRVVVGIESQQAANILQALHAPFLAKKAPFLAMSLESAELTKYAANAMLATRISFMNELTLLAGATGADIEHIKAGIAADKRIGPCFLNPGVGYGGSCFPKDVKALVAMGREHGIPMALVHEVDAVNNRQRSYFLDMILNYYGSEITHKTIGIWGLSFKPETDDIRNAPSIDIITGLLARGANVVVYDPVAEANVYGVFADAIKYASSADQVLQQCDSLVLLTEWREFVAHKPGAFLTLADRVVFDGRNCFDPCAMAQRGIRYFTVGRNCYQCQN
ncbi:MAG: UDP-glucose/GDP-mannose dehydrogenase family protein [Candidatus Babeliales bacterium]